MNSRIHVFGASGSGTTTLAHALGIEMGILHLDADDYYWKKTDPPFVHKNSADHRVKMIRLELEDNNSWVLSGSICGWGDVFGRDFTLAVFLYLDRSVRMQRLKERERRRYGNRVDSDGDLHAHHNEFIAWAESYDSARAPTRSLHLHETWMNQLSCPILRVDSNRSREQLVQAVLDAVA